MSNVTTLARPYAKAAFELAVADNATARWDEMLAFAASLVSDETMTRLLQSPQVGSKQMATVLADIAGELFDDRFRDYLSVLAVNKRFPLVPEIAKLYRKLQEDAAKLLRVKVISAYPLDTDQADRLKDALARRYEREILLESEVDSSIIGGAIVYADGQVIDGSLKGRLAKLSNSLSH